MAAFAALEMTQDARTGLQDFGVAHLRFSTDSNTIAIVRLAIAEGGQSDLGRQLHQRGPAVMLGLLSSYMQQLINKVKLTGANAKTMVLHLKGLYQAKIFGQCLFGAADSAEYADFPAMAGRAVDTFSIYTATRVAQRLATDGTKPQKHRLPVSIYWQISLRGVTSTACLGTKSIHGFASVLFFTT